MVHNTNVKIGYQHKNLMEDLTRAPLGGALYARK
jgi:hypothetical protein